MLCHGGHRQSPKKRKDFTSILQVPTRKFPDDKRMADHVTFIQQRFKSRIPIA